MYLVNWATPVDVECARDDGLVLEDLASPMGLIVPDIDNAKKLCVEEIIDMLGEDDEPVPPEQLTWEDDRRHDDTPNHYRLMRDGELMALMIVRELPPYPAYDYPPLEEFDNNSQ